MRNEAKLEDLQPHIQLSKEIVNTDSAVIMGDPARVDKITALLEEPEELAFNREYKSVIGTYQGKRILAISTGVGAPSAAIGIEELNNIGIQYIIRVGSAGAMQKEINLGELVIGEGVVRDDGLTKKYVPAIYPAVPSFELMSLARKYAPSAVYGIIRSHDGFYMDDTAEQEKFWSEKGIVADDMESGTLMVVGRQRGIKTLSILNNVVLFHGDLAEGINDLVDGNDAVAQGEIKSLKLALKILSSK
ncbi:MAG: nucleoside phosphorylase [Micrococcaceae bacterium]